MIKTLTFGDIHGRTIWEKFADVSVLIETPNLKTDYDYYIFEGDYTDSYTETNVIIKHNLERIIRFKKNYPDNVILLFGNHDLQYYNSYATHGCSGFRPEAYHDLNEIFRQNKDLFQVAFQLGDVVWTHAGIHRGWYNVEFPFHSSKIADDLNGAFHQNVSSLFDVGHRRGGFKNQGGPFWADKHETTTKPLRGISQVIGHTAIKEIKVYTADSLGNYVCYVDCLEHGKALEITISDNKISEWKEIQVDTTKYFEGFE